MKAEAPGLALPRYRHLPGVNARHDEGAFDAARQQCLPVTESRSWAQNGAWLYGLRLYEEAFYWEAHEVLEEVWQRALPNSRERWLVQAVIHLANAALKNALDRPRAARRLAVLAGECSDRAFAGEMAMVMGISADAMIQARQMVVTGSRPSGLLD